jgi:hypothetical protein
VLAGGIWWHLQKFFLSLLFLPFPNSFKRYHFCIYIDVYTVFAPDNSWIWKLKTWCLLVILSTWESEVGESQFKASIGKSASYPIWKKKSKTPKDWGHDLIGRALVLQVQDPNFSPLYTETGIQLEHQTFMSYMNLKFVLMCLV